MPKPINFFEKSYLTSYSPFSNCLCQAPNHAAVGISFNVFSYDAVSGRDVYNKAPKIKVFHFFTSKK